MKYKVLSKECFQIGHYALIPVRMEDRFSIKQWRNEQIDILRQKELLTDNQQEKYFRDVIQKLYSEDFPDQLIFSFLKNDVLIGYGGLVHIDWAAKVAEISFLLETIRNDNVELFKWEFSMFLKILKVVAFSEIKLFKISTFAFDLRDYLYPPLLDNDFKEEARIRGVNLIKGKRYDTVIHSCFIVDSPRNSSATFNVLVTSISAKTSLLKQVKSAINRSEINGLLYGGDIDDLCVGRHFVDCFWKMPLLVPENVGEIRSFCQQHNIKCIIPSRDGELLFWSKSKDEFLSLGISIMVSNSETIRTTIDKLQFSLFGCNLGFPIIPSSLRIDAIDSSVFVVKERFGAGSKNVELNLSKEEAIAHSKKVGRPIFQPFVKGAEYSVDLYVQLNGEVKGVICRRRVKVVNGESQVTVTVHDTELSDICSKLAKVLKLYGHVLFQVLKDDNGIYHIIECNARFGGASNISIVAGLDSLYWFLQESMGKNIESIPFRPVTNSLRQMKFSSDLIDSIELNSLV